MNKHGSWRSAFYFAILVGCLFGSASASKQSLELVMGLPETADLRYGMEWKYGGASISPGLGFLTVPLVRSDKIIPITWNPVLAIYKTWMFGDRFGIRPNIDAMYMYGYGGMSATGGFEYTHTRIDAIYLKEGLA